MRRRQECRQLKTSFDLRISVARGEDDSQGNKHCWRGFGASIYTRRSKVNSIGSARFLAALAECAQCDM